MLVDMQHGGLQSPYGPSAAAAMGGISQGPGAGLGGSLGMSSSLALFGEPQNYYRAHHGGYPSMAMGGMGMYGDQYSAMR